MTVVYADGYAIDIGTHVFPTRKYGTLYDRIRACGAGADFVTPGPATWDDLALVHTPEYLYQTRTGAFDISQLALLEVPWSIEVVEGFRLMTGGTIEAARRAVASPDARGRRQRGGPTRVFHIGGGFHHAFPDHGEGFCFFNDVAVALRVLFKEGAIERAAVIDLDVHHGNGTAFIFHTDPRVFTFSMHQQRNYPSIKPRGSLDVGLEDGTEDDEYLDRLALPDVMAHRPDLVFYLAGADPYEGDQLGGLALTKSGLRQRDRLVFDACDAAGVPAVILLAGGYARHLDDTVDIHLATFQEASGPSRS